MHWHITTEMSYDRHACRNRKEAWCLRLLVFFWLVRRQVSEEVKPEKSQKPEAAVDPSKQKGEAGLQSNEAARIPETTPETFPPAAVPADGEPKDSEQAEPPKKELQMVYELDEIGNSADPPHFECGFSKRTNLWWLKEIATGVKRHAHEATSLNLPKEIVDSLNSGIPYYGDVAPVSFHGFRTSVSNTREEPDPKRQKTSEADGPEGVPDAKVGFDI